VCQEYACEIVLEGADRGTPKEEPVPPIPISYARTYHTRQSTSTEVLIAYKMNGRDLPMITDIRCGQLGPGYYGMASVRG